MSYLALLIKFLPHSRGLWGHKLDRKGYIDYISSWGPAICGAKVGWIRSRRSSFCDNKHTTAQSAASVTRISRDASAVINNISNRSSGIRRWNVLDQWLRGWIGWSLQASRKRVTLPLSRRLELYSERERGGGLSTRGAC